LRRPRKYGSFATVQDTCTLLIKRRNRGVEFVSVCASRDLDLLPRRGARILQFVNLKIVIDERRIQLGADQIRVEDRALVFRSHQYFVDFGRWRLTLPRWATPGTLTVRHIEAEGERFVFVMEIIHPWLGMLVRQSAIFQEAGP